MIYIRSFRSLAMCASILTLVLSGCATSEKAPLTSREKASLFLEMANGSLMEGDASGALASVFEAERLDPLNPGVYHTKSLAFFAKKDLDEAISAANRAVELEPKYSEARNTLGKLLVDKGESQEAEKHLLKATKDPLYRDAYKSATTLGIIYYRRGDYNNAERFFTKAIIESPINACVAHYYRGHIWLQQGQVEKSIRDYEKATQKLCASFAEAQFAIGVAFARNKQYDKAREKFIEVKKLYPDTKVAEQAMERLRYIP